MFLEQNPDGRPWFALYVKPRHEKTVAAALEYKGFGQYLPLCNRSKRLGQPPLFPSYVFSCFEANNRFPILSIPGVFSIVSIGRMPAPIDIGELAGIQAAVRSGYYLEACEYFHKGDRVWIHDGPLRGITGVVAGGSGSARLILSVTLLRRSVAVHVDESMLSHVPVERLSPDARGVH